MTHLLFRSAIVVSLILHDTLLFIDRVEVVIHLVVSVVHIDTDIFQHLHAILDVFGEVLGVRVHGHMRLVLVVSVVQAERHRGLHHGVLLLIVDRRRHLGLRLLLVLLLVGLLKPLVHLLLLIFEQYFTFGPVHVVRRGHLHA